MTQFTQNRFPMPPRKFWKVLELFVFVKFQEPGKSWKMSLVLESLGNLSARSCRVMEFSRH